jgi:cell division protein FtsW
VARFTQKAYVNGNAEGERRIHPESAAEPTRRSHVDWQFLILLVMLMSIGLVMLFSASFANAYYEQRDALAVFRQQAIYAVAGAALMFLASTVRVSALRRHSYRKYAMPLLAASIFLLLLTLPELKIPIALTRNGARRWIKIGGFQFQPSEIAKLGLILGFAHMMCREGHTLVYGAGRAAKLRRRSQRLGAFARELLPFFGIVAVIAALLLKEPHTSATIIICAIAAIMLFADGLDKRVWVPLLIFAAIAAALIIYKAEEMYNEAYAQYSAGTITQEEFRDAFGDYKLSRIVFWLHPDADPRGKGYQTLQSLYAVGSGGLLGQGFGMSRQKFFYLPEEHNDYIFAIICEEIGFLGAIVILILFALLIVRGFWIALRAKDKFSSLAVIGIMGMLAMQVGLNIAVVTNSLPCTGISLPFFSYGGTALMIQLIEMGIVLSVSRDMKLSREG